MNEIPPRSALQVFESRLQSLEQSGDVKVLYREVDELDDPFYIVQLAEHPLINGDDFASIEFILDTDTSSLTLTVLAGGRESHPGIENMCHRLHIVAEGVKPIGGAIFNGKGQFVRQSNLFGSMTAKTTRIVSEQFRTFRSKMR